MALNKENQINWSKEKIDVIQVLSVKDMSAKNVSGLAFVTWQGENYVRKTYDDKRDLKGMADKINHYYGPGNAYVIDENTILMKRFYPEAQQKDTIKPDWVVLDPNKENFVGGNLIDFDYVYNLKHQEPLDKAGADYLNTRLTMGKGTFANDSDIDDWKKTKPNKMLQDYINRHPNTNSENIKEFFRPWMQSVLNDNQQRFASDKLELNETLSEYIYRQLTKDHGKEKADKFLKLIEKEEFNEESIKQDLNFKKDNVENKSDIMKVLLEEDNDEEEEEEDTWLTYEHDDIDEKKLYQSLTKYCENFDKFNQELSQFKSNVSQEDMLQEKMLQENMLQENMSSQNLQLTEYIAQRLEDTYGNDVSETFRQFVEQEEYGQKGAETVAEDLEDINKNGSNIVEGILEKHDYIKKESLNQSLKNYCRDFKNFNNKTNQLQSNGSQENMSSQNLQLTEYIEQRLKDTYGHDVSKTFRQFVEKEEYDQKGAETVAEDLEDINKNDSNIVEGILEKHDDIEKESLNQSLKSYCEEFKILQKSNEVNSHNEKNWNQNNSNTFFKSSNNNNNNKPFINTSIDHDSHDEDNNNENYNNHTFN